MVGAISRSGMYRSFWSGLSQWLTRSRETVKRLLDLPADTTIIWKSHDDSIAQRTAIDQARQDKGGPEKRRNTLTLNEKEKPAA